MIYSALMNEKTPHFSRSFQDSRSLQILVCLWIVLAQVSSAVELNAPQKAEMKSTLERLTGKRVEANFLLEPELLGGAVVRVGDTVYDGSLRSRLNELRARLTSE